MEHAFTQTLKDILTEEFGEAAPQIYESSLLLQYINLKTRSANRGSKARGSFANLYAIYVTVEDYLTRGFDKNAGYRDAEGAKFTNLYRRQRELPFGSKLQNHALNSRLNEEYRKYFPTTENTPIIRDLSNNRYWVNENLLIVEVGNKKFNTAPAIIRIIDAYIDAKQNAFAKFIQYCEKLRHIEEKGDSEAVNFVVTQLAPNVDARVFEIVSYGILKYYYHDRTVFFGFDLDNLQEENLILYKTGRTNANDGGIDFVMKPLGRFFQVTETTDIRKYFLDIDKLEHYPITFVVKSADPIETLKANIREKAEEQYPITAIVDRYMDCIEEIINVEVLLDRFNKAVKNGYLGHILDEIIKQSKVEFNYVEEED